MPTDRKTKGKVGKPLILSLPEPISDTPVNIRPGPAILLAAGTQLVGGFAGA